MTRRTLALALVTAGLGLAACGGGDDDPAADPTATPAAATATGTPSSGSGAANTAEVVEAAKAFLATLSDDERSTVVFGFDDDAKTTSWSNLPAALSPRRGIALGDMSEKQRTAALALMETALSDQGYEELQEVREADDHLAQAGSSGGGGQGGPPGGADDYGAGNYFLAFYGEPSADAPWLLQYTGHHLTYDIAYEGDEASFGPAFEGVEPISFEQAGKTIAPLADEASGFGGILEALDEDQRGTAELSRSFDDLLLGAGDDGPFPDAPEGVKVSDLSQEAQDAVTRTIRAYVGDLDDGAADALLQSYVDAYDETSFAYAGGTDTEELGFYARIDGPKVWIEISTQRGVVLEGTHYHSIYREEGGDYGA